jgi:hypothetical protein
MPFMLAMDVSPPCYTCRPTEAARARLAAAAAGDTACRQQAENDGHVPISLYQFCPREDVHIVPRPAGIAFATALVVVLVAVGIGLWRRRGARPR